MSIFHAVILIAGPLLILVTTETLHGRSQQGKHRLRMFGAVAAAVWVVGSLYLAWLSEQINSLR